MSLVVHNRISCLGIITKRSIFCFITLISFLYTRAQHDQSEAILSKIQQLSSQEGFSKKDTVYLNLLNDLAYSQRYYNTDSLLLVSKQAISYSITAEYIPGEINGLLNLGNYHSEKGEVKTAIVQFDRALNLAKSEGHQELTLQAQNALYY